MAIDYPKLEADLRAAVASAWEAAGKSDDGGTCNLDSLMLTIPRAQVVKIQAAAKAAGATHAAKSHRAGHFYVGLPCGGQANSRTAAVEAARNSLKTAGWQAWVSYLID